MLHSLVFGEGVINDATSLVILRALDATGHSKATTIGWGLLPAFARIFAASLLLGVGVCGWLHHGAVTLCFVHAHTYSGVVCCYPQHVLSPVATHPKQAAALASMLQPAPLCRWAC